LSKSVCKICVTSENTWMPLWSCRVWELWFVMELGWLLIGLGWLLLIRAGRFVIYYIDSNRLDTFLRYFLGYPALPLAEFLNITCQYCAESLVCAWGSSAAWVAGGKWTRERKNGQQGKKETRKSSLQTYRSIIANMLVINWLCCVGSQREAYCKVESGKAGSTQAWRCSRFWWTIAKYFFAGIWLKIS